MSPLLRLALPALAAVGTVFAADCSTSGTATIQNGGDATAIAGCQTYSGSIAISTGLSDDISFDGKLETIDGDLVIEHNQNIKRIGSGSLQTITGALTVNDVSQLASLTFSKLTEVDTLTLLGLPNLRNLGFDAVVTKASELDIENTQLQDLTGINIGQAKKITIANNDAVSSISMDLTNVTGPLILSNNNNDVNVSFPKLEGANNITFEKVGSISIPALSTVTGGDLVVVDSGLETLAAPNLTTIGGALSLRGNENLSNVSFPLLTKVTDALQIANSSNLKTIDGFPNLEEATAAFDVSGDFTKISTPKLSFVKGVFNLQSTGDIGTVCADFYDPLKNNNKLGPKNKYVCQGKLQTANTAGTTPTGGAKPTGAASPLNVQSTYLGLAGLAALMLA